MFWCASVSRPGLGKTYPAFLCACFSVSAGCFSSAYESSLGSRPSVLAIFRGGAVFSPSVWSCSRFLAAFWWTGDEQHEQTMHFSHLKLKNSKQVLLLPPFCPTADEDIAAGCLSSLWRWLKKDRTVGDKIFLSKVQRGYYTPRQQKIITK